MVYGIGNGCGENWSESEYILKVEPTGFPNRLDEDMKEKEESVEQQKE